MSNAVTVWRRPVRKSLDERIDEVTEIIIADLRAYRGGPTLLGKHLARIDELGLSKDDAALWRQRVKEDWEQKEAEWAKPKSVNHEKGPQTDAGLQVSAKPEAKPASAGALPSVVAFKPPSDERVSYDDAIAMMNDKHAVIDNVGGKTVIASWEPSPLDPKRRMIVFQGKESFLLCYANRSVMIDMPDGMGGYKPTRMPAGNWWLHHRDRQQYCGVTFRPDGGKIVEECLNLWQGWGVMPEGPSDWSLIKRHIEEVVAGGNAEFADYVIRWIAWGFQNPAAQAEVALVLIGAKGTGKGTLARALQKIFGAHAFQVTSREEVIGKFNGHLQDCVLFVADEAYWGGDKRCVGRLQGIITEPTLPIERKGFDLILVPNYLHVLMLAEPDGLFRLDGMNGAMQRLSLATVEGEIEPISKHCIARLPKAALMECIGI